MNEWPASAFDAQGQSLQELLKFEDT